MAFKILTEHGGLMHYFHSASGYTSGFTASKPFYIIPAPNLILHVGLARLHGTSREAGGATIGISQYSFLNARGTEQTVYFGDESQWETALYAQRVIRFTISVFVLRSSMKGWFYYQGWEQV